MAYYVTQKAYWQGVLVQPGEIIDYDFTKIPGGIPKWITTDPNYDFGGDDLSAEDARNPKKAAKALFGEAGKDQYANIPAKKKPKKPKAAPVSKPEQGGVNVNTEVI